MLKLLKDFFAAVINTRKGILVPEELLRSILASLGTGSVMSLVLTVVQSLLAHVSLIFPNPLIGGLVTLVLTLLLDLTRRLNQGPAIPVPVPGPVPLVPINPVDPIAPGVPIVPVIPHI